MRPVNACRISMERATDGQNTISVMGNVLRDYLTDLFPIIELGTSAKMLLIVPLLAGGGPYEMGAGGSAPKHVQQFVVEGHLRWDSLGEYLAMAIAFEHLGETTGNEKAKMLGDTLNQAVALVLDHRKSPSCIVNQIVNHATNFYVCLYLADFLHQHDPAYTPIFEKLTNARLAIIAEFKKCQGNPVDLSGYYLFDADKARAAMNPLPTLNVILTSM